MRIAGKRVKRTRLIQKGRYVVAVDVEMVIPPDDPTEPCYEAETVRFLKELAERAAYSRALCDRSLDGPARRP